LDCEALGGKEDSCSDAYDEREEDPWRNGGAFFEVDEEAHTEGGEEPTEPLRFFSSISKMV
jgi:hypothetical protein